MNYVASLFLPAVLGLVAGVSHGVVAHYTDLPVSLAEQMVQPWESGDALRD